jgi:hypothetical protein
LLEADIGAMPLGASTDVGRRIAGLDSPAIEVAGRCQALLALNALELSDITLL